MEKGTEIQTGSRFVSENTFLVWDNKERKFIESVGHNGIFYTDSLDSAFQFTKKSAANDVLELIDDGAILKWL